MLKCCLPLTSINSILCSYGHLDLTQLSRLPFLQYRKMNSDLGEVRRRIFDIVVFVNMVSLTESCPCSVF